MNSNEFSPTEIPEMQNFSLGHRCVGLLNVVVLSPFQYEKKNIFKLQLMVVAMRKRVKSERFAKNEE